jgi:Holliday junction resolvasome RuvABC endonuclease subunit
MSKHKRIIAFDPGLCCGWAKWDAEVGGVEYGVIDVKKERKVDKGFAFSVMRKEIVRIIGVKIPTLVVYEGVMRHNGTIAAHAYGAIEAIILEAASAIACDVYTFTPGEIKKFATGNGRARKEEMIAAANTKMGIQISNDNIADALWILELAREKFYVKAED